VKRWTLRILLCLILGAVTTVAVAWGLAVFGKQELARSKSIIHEEYYAFLHDGPGRERIGFQSTRVAEDKMAAWEATNAVWELAMIRACVVAQTSEWPEEIPADWQLRVSAMPGFATDNANLYVFERYGWPCLGIEATIEFGGDPVGAEVFGGIDYTSEITPSIHLHDVRFLPIRPVWPGFLIDTLFYGGIWLGLFFGVGAARRGVRRRRGRCVRCGYDLRGQRQESPHPQPLSRGERGTSGGGCPECGWRRAD